MLNTVVSSEMEYGLYPIDTTNFDTTLSLLETLSGRIGDQCRNGSRIYADTGKHPECALPEFPDPFTMLIYEKAGDRHMYWAARKLSKTRGTKIRVLRHCVDILGNTWGYHQNFQTLRRVPINYLVKYIGPLITALTPLTGSGNIIRKEGDIFYLLSQRSEHIEVLFSGATTNNRGIINTRDEPHADEEKFRRLHLITFDPALVDPPPVINSGAVAMALRILEEGKNLPSFPWTEEGEKKDDLDYAAWLLRKFSSDASLKRSWPAPGGSVSALGILELYQKAFSDWEPRYPEGWEKKWLALFKNFISRLKLFRDTQNLDYVTGWTDWATKLTIITRDMVRFNYDWSFKSLQELTIPLLRKQCPWTAGERMLDISISYHVLDKEGLFFKWRDKYGKRFKRLASNQEILHAMLYPPPGMRSNWRFEIRKEIWKARRMIMEQNLDYSGFYRNFHFTWAELLLSRDDGARGILSNKDPFRSNLSNEELQKLRKELTALVLLGKQENLG